MAAEDDYPVTEGEGEGEETDEETQQEVEELDDQARDIIKVDEDLRKQAASAFSSAATISRESSVILEMDEMGDFIETRYSTDGEQGSSTGRQTRRNIAQADDGIARTRRRYRHITQTKYLALYIGVGGIIVSALGSVATGAISLIALVLAETRDGDKEPKLPGLSDEDKKHIRDLVKRWQSLDEDTFWDTMADYVTNWTPSVDAQILFMRYTKILFGHEEKWTWDSEEPESEARKYVDAFATDRSFADLYRSARDYRSNSGMRPPRNATASLCEVALCIIRHNLLLQRKSR